MNAALQRLPYPTGRLADGQARAILFDASRCIGCRQCVEACKDWNDLPRGNSFRLGASTWLAIEPPVMEGQALVWGRKSCVHCEYPLCAAVCPVEAITKYEEGPVVIDPARCIGCEFCVHACPWGAIAKDPMTQKARKCTMCYERLAEKQTPFCVSACPVNALDFGSLEEVRLGVEKRATELNETIYGLREAGGTQVLHLLTRAPGEHALPSVAPERFPRHHVPVSIMLRMLTLTGGLAGKWRALANAVRKPWRLKYRYWHGGR